MEYYKRALDMDPKYAEGWFHVAEGYNVIQNTYTILLLTSFFHLDLYNKESYQKLSITWTVY